MAEKKIIAVLGATGAQGGGVVRATLNDKNSPFAARALTRDVNGDKARWRPKAPRSSLTRAPSLIRTSASSIL